MPRRRHDFHETPKHYVTALARVIGVPRGHLYDPCVGTHNIQHYLPIGKGARWHTNDIDRKRTANTHLDARRRVSWGTLGYEWVITNVPFKSALPIVEHMLSYGKNVAVLVRLSFLEPTLTRRRFWRRLKTGRGMPTVIVLPRYSFRKNDRGKRQTDSVTCCWLVWQEGRKSSVRISLLREH